MANEVRYKEPPICGIYMIINNITGHQYIGQSKDILRRYKQHLSTKSHGTPELHRDLAQIGEKYAILLILEECDPELLNEREKFYIERHQPEYNKSLGPGRLGLKTSEYAKQKAREGVIAYWNNLPKEEQNEKIEAMRKAHKRGYHLSDETKRKIAEKQKGTKFSEEAKLHRQETLRKKKEAGYVRENKGSYVPIICTTTGEEFESVKGAAQYYGIYAADISNVLRGIQKTTHGMKFEYKEKRNGNN